ncbi:LysR family transcriptional regulator [Acidisoma cellulosilytica]|uniref:LysR family transcriptional regulator n=1 Tax=Acidisoma cellulosilyticum TaxID=2802395 RepID=A0A963Z442_9PROT|nr:LysR family transcriptional regulator [Acidisoma cellulosilyticum]MCB8882171.1 LysR family transcriptional regulator [Acidisoma cellulosilyticum]
MEYADLRVLEAVARHGSMNRAAVELNMVQSNVTARIRILEDQVGTPLFDRSRRGVVLTAAGQRLLPYASRLSAILKEAYAAARDDGVPRGMLTIGSLETTAALRLPPILASFMQAHPSVDLVLTTDTSNALVEDVLARKLDGAFVAGPVQHPDLREETVFQEELMLVTAPGVTSLKALARLPEVKIIVFRRGCSYRQRLDNLLAQLGIQTARHLEFGSLDAILGCVAAGVGISLLPRAVVSPFWQDGRVLAHELPPQDARVATMFIHHKDVHPSSALRAFLATARPLPMPPQRMAAE